jgi:hypothetical protein
MVTQVLAISLILLSGQIPVLQFPAEIALWGTMVFALASAADYVRKFWRQVDERIKERRRMELLRLETDRQRAAMQAAKRERALKR